MRLGMGEMIIILVVVLLVFGANKIPQLGDALGKGIRNFKKATQEGFADEPAAQPQLPAAQAQAPVVGTAREVAAR
jgi:sec-independent protein translocase protein TatA